MGKITARVISYEEGLTVVEEADLVRINSKNLSLLILSDYMPVMGEVDGTVSVVKEDTEKTYEDIKGFFLHRKNQFELLITDKGKETAAS